MVEIEVKVDMVVRCTCGNELGAEIRKYMNMDGSFVDFISVAPCLECTPNRKLLAVIEYLEANVDRGEHANPFSGVNLGAGGG